MKTNYSLQKPFEKEGFPMTQQKSVQIAIILSALLLILSSVLHVTAYFVPVPTKWIPPLFICIFPLAFFVAINIKQKPLKDPLDIFKKPIDPVFILTILIFIYAWFSGIINMTTLSNGSGTIQNGQYFLECKGV